MSKEALRVLIWPDYAIRGVEELFFAATGVGVEWSFFDQNEEAFARFRAAPERFDVVLADGMWPEAYRRAGLIQSFELSAMRGWSELIPAAQRWCAKAWVSGVGSLIAFPCFWGLRGIVYAPDVVGRPESWSALLGAPRRSLWLNSQGSEVIAEIALGMGVAPGRVYELTDGELAQVGRRLAQLAPSVGGIWRVLSELVNAFEEGAALAEVHTTSLLDNVERALGKPLAATIPAEGTIAYIDGAMIGSACRNPEAAMLFVDILSSPEGVLA
ncbi:MAG: extracellular solute-binding protein, partial [Candidatus Dormiibacterota bacterium]